MSAVTPSVSVLGVPVSRLGLEATIRLALERSARGQGGYVCFVNVHTVTESGQHAGLREALQQAWLCAADGLPLVWAARLLGAPVDSRVCGPDFMLRCLKEHADREYGFIGGAPGQAEEITRRFGLRSVSYCNPIRPFSPANAREDWGAFLARCPERRVPSLVWIGLGAPKQEQWMREVSALAPQTLFFGVGAAFDFLAQTKRRAPHWMQRTGLEWFYRLLQEPRRLGKRYLLTNFAFVWRVGRQWRTQRLH